MNPSRQEPEDLFSERPRDNVNQDQPEENCAAPEPHSPVLDIGRKLGMWMSEAMDVGSYSQRSTP